MYTPSFNRIDDDDEIRRFVAAARSAEFVTVDPDGHPVATLLPIMWDGDTVVAHMARANPQWKSIAPASPALLICTGPAGLRQPVVVRGEDRTRPGGADVELQRRAPVRHGDSCTRTATGCAMRSPG